LETNKKNNKKKVHSHLAYIKKKRKEKENKNETNKDLTTGI